MVKRFCDRCQNQIGKNSSEKIVIDKKSDKNNVKVTNIYRDTIANIAALGRNISKDLIEKIMCS